MKIEAREMIEKVEAAKRKLREGQTGLDEALRGVIVAIEMEDELEKRGASPCPKPYGDLG